jgi:hypothetical protein
MRTPVQKMMERLIEATRDYTSDDESRIDALFTHCRNDEENHFKDFFLKGIIFGLSMRIDLQNNDYPNFDQLFENLYYLKFPDE